MKRAAASQMSTLLSVMVLVLFATTLFTPQKGVTGEKASAWKIHDWSRPRPAIVAPPTGSTQEITGTAPSDAVVLFNGSDLSNWRTMDGGAAKWIVRDGYMESVRGAGYVRTLQGFGDCQLHVEFVTPTPPHGDSQGRGNSGVFLMGVYEVQVLDSYDNITYADGQCSAVYGEYPPQVNVCRKPGEWQTYDIIFKAPRFKSDGTLAKSAHITVLQNGVLTQDNVEITGPTDWCSHSPYKWHPEKMPLALQDHGNPVRYRNIWVRELPAKGTPDAYRKELIFGDKELQKYAGLYKNKRGGKVAMTLKKGQLYSSHPGGASGQPLHAESQTRFYSNFVNAEYEFGLKDGAPVSLKVSVAHGGWEEYTKEK